MIEAGPNMLRQIWTSPQAYLPTLIDSRPTASTGLISSQVINENYPCQK